MQGRRIVLFGGSGFIGRHLARRLADDGWQVRVAARHAAAGADPTTRPVDTVVADLRDEATVRAAMVGAEVVVNLVGIGRERRQSFDEVHVAGAARVARLGAAAGADRLLHVSALGIGEAAPSAADRSKARGELAVRAAFPAATVLRPSLVYGPSDHFFARFAAMARHSPLLVVIGGGRTLFQPIFIDDAVETVVRLLARADMAGRTLALAGAETLSFRALLERMLELQGSSRGIVSLPFPAAAALAAAARVLPDPPITVEEVRLLRTDKIAGDLPTPASFGVACRPLRQGLAVSLPSRR
jgi:NADH dehydrogenase